MRTSSRVASPTAAIHRFAEVSNAKIQRSRFDRSHGLKTTFNAGLVVPIFWMRLCQAIRFRCLLQLLYVWLLRFSYYGQRFS